MFNKKALLLVGCAFLLVGCGGAAADEGMDYEQNTNPEIVESEMYIIGSHWNNWDPASIKEANPSCKFVKNEEGLYEYTATVTADMAGAWVGFKFIGTNSWNQQYGAEDIDIDACNDAYKTLIGYTDRAGYEAINKEGVSNRTNVINTTIDASYVGTYLITYNPFDFRSSGDLPYGYKFVIDFTPAA